jgi:N-carbamoyl-L-amino-acid hydrolase
VARVRGGAARLGYSHRDIVSGAAHDAVYLARVAPTAMIFSPCKDGITHNNHEHADLERTVPAANVLANVVLERANR